MIIIMIIDRINIIIRTLRCTQEIRLCSNMSRDEATLSYNVTHFYWSARETQKQIAQILRNNYNNSCTRIIIMIIDRINIIIRILRHTHTDTPLLKHEQGPGHAQLQCDTLPLVCERDSRTTTTYVIIRARASSSYVYCDTHIQIRRCSNRSRDQAMPRCTARTCRCGVIGCVQQPSPPRPRGDP